MRLTARTSAAGVLLAFVLGVLIGASVIYQYREQARIGTTTTVTLFREPYPKPLRVLVDTDYFDELRRVLPRANRSVYVLMYVVKYDPKEPDDPVNQLLHALADLSSRGVDVRVVVDDETYRSYYETIGFLKSYGVPVRLDEGARTTTHAKVVIVDEETVFVGSHNWTESALTLNREVSVVIKDPSISQSIVRYFTDMWNRGRDV